jgi:ABC-2 type transport system ATP-binding protein
LSPDQPPALSVQELSYAFGPRRVLHDVNLAVRPGDFSILLGLNGAGKTTLFALITRLYSARKGRIAVFGHDIEREPLAALARLGVVFQQATLDLDLTVEQNLYYHAALHGMTRAEARPRIEEELTRIALLDRKRERVRALSGGQKRRVELARALLHDPSLLLLDEPTVGLDMESRHFLLQHVQSLCRTRALGVLWATHLIDEAADASRVIVLHHGRVLEDAPVREITQAGETLKNAFDRLTRKEAA